MWELSTSKQQWENQSKSLADSYLNINPITFLKHFYLFIYT